jgi:hypothetical protein
MSGAARFSYFRLPISILVLMGFLACCVTVHFIVDDLLIQPCQAAAAAGMPGSDELTHQDDLVFIAELPAHVPAIWLWSFVPAELPLQVRVFYPLRLPPKI